LRSPGIRKSRWAWVRILSALGGTHPSTLLNRKTCVSTAKESRPRQKRRTQEAVLGPTPSYDNSSFIISSSVILWSSSTAARCCNEYSPCRSFMDIKIFCIVVAFLFARPPERIELTTSAWVAAAIATKLFLPNVSSSDAFARELFTPDVFWDRIVPMRASMTLRTLPHVWAELLEARDGLLLRIGLCGRCAFKRSSYTSLASDGIGRLKLGNGDSAPVGSPPFT
jgi:hypothetical protein